MVKEFVDGVVEVAKDLVKDIPPKHKILGLCVVGIVAIAGMAIHCND